MAGGCTKLHKDELHNFYSSPNEIRMIKSRRKICAGHVARMERVRMHVGYGWETRTKESARKTST
jgi:hypothetical protein